MRKSFIATLIVLSCLATSLAAHETMDDEMDYFAISPGISQSGLIFSFSGFNEYRMGMGVFFGSLGRVGHHPHGNDFGLLFEFNFKDNITYTRFYYHMTGGVSAMLMGVSMVIASDSEDMSIGWAPEIGMGLSTLFKMFYRYNFYTNNRFNSYEIVFHLCLSRRD